MVYSEVMYSKRDKIVLLAGGDVSLQYTFTLISKEDVRELRTWRYPEPYTMYSMAGNEDGDDTEMLDRRSPYYAVRNEQGELAGFFCYGTAALPWESQVSGLYSEDHILPIGLGMRPDLTGQGLGMNFVVTGLNFAREHFAPRSFLLYVLTFNVRAARVYEKAGFRRERVLTVHNMYGERAFLEMTRPV